MRRIIIGALAFILAGCASQQQFQAKHYSGFLPSYKSLQKVDTASGSDVWRWVSPKLKHHNYKSIYFEPFSFYPMPETHDQISKDALIKIKDLIENRAHAVATELNVPVAKQKGPGVLVIRSALTSLSVEQKGLSALDLIPIRLVISGAEFATGTRDEDVTFLIETELNDGVTGKPVTTSVRRIKTEPLKNDTQQLTTANIKTVIEQLQQDLKTDFTQLKSLIKARQG